MTVNSNADSVDHKDDWNRGGEPDTEVMEDVANVGGPGPYRDDGRPEENRVLPRAQPLCSEDRNKYCRKPWQADEVPEVQPLGKEIAGVGSEMLARTSVTQYPALIFGSVCILENSSFENGGFLS
jgi:hypothetical protein